MATANSSWELTVGSPSEEKPKVTRAVTVARVAMSIKRVYKRRRPTVPVNHVGDMWYGFHLIAHIPTPNVHAPPTLGGAYGCQEMTVFCTYCSNKKSREPDDIPAIQRYKSCRIKKVYAATLLVGLPFRVLSGKCGLVSPERPIPDYNHLLTPEEAPTLAQTVVRQIRAEGVTRLVYFTRPLSTDPKVLPYHDALAIACRETSISLCVVEIGEQEDELME